MLNSSHKRALGAALGEVEKELRSLIRLLQTGEDRLFLHISDDLTQQEKELLVEKIERLIDRLIHLKNLFGLKPTERVLRWIARATAVYLSIQLTEVASESLKGHGEVTAEAEEALDPILNGMISILHEMESVMSKPEIFRRGR